MARFMTLIAATYYPLKMATAAVYCRQDEVIVTPFMPHKPLQSNISIVFTSAIAVRQWQIQKFG